MSLFDPGDHPWRSPPIVERPEHKDVQSLDSLVINSVVVRADHANELPMPEVDPKSLGCYFCRTGIHARCVFLPSHCFCRKMNHQVKFPEE